MLRKTARDSRFWHFVWFLDTFRTSYSTRNRVFSIVCDNTASPRGRARLLDEVVSISNFLLTCRVSCSQAADESSSNPSGSSSVLSLSGGASVGESSFCPLRSHPSKPSWVHGSLCACPMFANCRARSLEYLNCPGAHLIRVPA